MTPAVAESVRDLVERAVRAGSAPGGVAGWRTQESNELTVIAGGRAMVSPHSSDMTSSTWFDLASLTKPLVVGTLVLLAMRRGWLDLNTAVADVWPDAATRSIGPATVVDLLTHRAGLPSWAPVYALAEGRPDRALDAVLGLPISGARGRVVYSCAGFLLLGWMLEHRARATLDRLFDELVVEPLGLGDELGYRPSPDRPLAAGAPEARAEQRLILERRLDASWIPPPVRGLPDDGNARFLNGVAGNAGLFGTVRGVLELARVYLERDGFLTGAEIDLATEERTSGLGQSRGLGWQLAASPGCSAGRSLAAVAFGHTGFTGTSLWIDPTRGLAMTLLTNRTHPGHRDIDLHPLRRRFHRLLVDSMA